MKHLLLVISMILLLSSCTQEKVAYVDVEEIYKEYNVFILFLVINYIYLKLFIFIMMVQDTQLLHLKLLQGPQLIFIKKKP